MDYITLIILIIAIACIIIGLMLSGSGSTSNAIISAGQDLELFKKTKDRGIIKIMQIIMFLLLIALLGVLILSICLSI